MQECKTIREVIQLYLPEAKRELAPETFKMRARTLTLFDKDCGHLAIEEARAMDLHNWLNQFPAWSDWYRANHVTSVKRAFNWALDMELIQRNPFGRVRQRKGGRRKPMTDENFQVLMRAASPLFRRFLVMLKFTGARPSELCSSKWSDVRFDQGCILLEKHKTARKTGKPRRIPLVPTTVKLLVWMKLHRQVSTAELVERVLLPGPMKATEFASRMRIYGVSHMALVRARKALGVKKIRVKREEDPKQAEIPTAGNSKSTRGRKKTEEMKKLSEFCRDQLAEGQEAAAIVEKVRQLFGRSIHSRHVSTYARRAENRFDILGPVYVWAYALPPGYRPRKDWPREDFVFLNYDGNPWKRPALNLRILRIRKKTGVLKGASLYQLRHRYGLMGIKNKVNLKLLSLCMGHSDTRTTEIYIDEAGLTDDVQQAALQVAYGAGAMAMLPPPPKARMIPTIPQPPAPEQIQPVMEQLPNREGIPARPQIPLQPVTKNGDGSKLEYLVEVLLKKLAKQGEASTRRRSAPIPGGLSPSQASAFEAYQWAMKQRPELAKAEDRDVYEWLCSQKDFPGRLPPTITTWNRYLSGARLFHGFTKRPELTGRPTAPPAS
jgi:integrase